MRVETQTHQQAQLHILRVHKALEHGLVRGTRRQGEHKSASQCLLHVFGVRQMSAADPGLGGGGGGGGGARIVGVAGVGAARVWGSAVSSPIGRAPEALQPYYIPIMKRVRKSCFHRWVLRCLIIKRTCLRY